VGAEEVRAGEEACQSRDRQGAGDVHSLTLAAPTALRDALKAQEVILLEQFLLAGQEVSR
jgi:hypothetical protein